MHGHEQVGIERSLRLRAGDDVPAILVDRRGAAEDSAGGGRTQTNDQSRAEQRELAVEPLMTRLDLELVRLLVDAALAARLSLEVFDGVRNVGGLAIDGRVGQCAVEEFSGGADERLAGAVFLVTRLLADEHDAG